MGDPGSAEAGGWERVLPGESRQAARRRRARH